MAWDRYKSNTTSFEVQSEIGRPFYPRDFCDDPNGTVYVTKDPVCKLTLDPVEQFTNTDIAWDISASSSATGTIDTYDINWGGTTDIGNLSGQSWAGSKTGNVQFTTAGTYTVTATVTDTLSNKSKPCEVEVTIIDEEFGENANDRAYIGTTNGGLFILTPPDTLTQNNAGLTGNHANFRAMRFNPHYRDEASNFRHIWVPTEDGVAYTVDGDELERD